jgi:hypothetical protein
LLFAALCSFARASLFNNAYGFVQGKLMTGEVVAVKVQRPYVRETVTIYLFILRSIGVKANEIMDGKVRKLLEASRP